MLDQAKIALAVMDIMVTFGLACIFAQLHSGYGRLLSLFFFFSFLANIAGSLVLFNPQSPYIWEFSAALQLARGARGFVGFILIAKALGMLHRKYLGKKEEGDL